MPYPKGRKNPKLSRILSDKYKGSGNPNYRGGRFFKCLECGKEFWVIPSRFNTAKYCSRRCQNIALGRRHRGENNPAKRPEVREKISKNNPMKNPDIRKKWDKLMRGSENPAKRPEVRAKISVKKKLNNPTAFKPGKDNLFYGKKHSENALKKIRLARMRQKFPTYLTKPEKKFIKLIELHNLPFKYVGNGTFWIGYPPMNPDFVHLKKKIAIEIFGDYWHRRPGIPKLQTEEGREAAFAKYGWKLAVIWEYELENEDEVIQKVRKYV